MKSFILIIGLAVTLIEGAQNDVARFLVAPKTITSTVTSTRVVTSQSLVTKSCASIDPALPICRKRRNVMEVPVILEHQDDDSSEIDPSEPIQ